MIIALEYGMKTTYWIIQRADGKVYCGKSTISGQPLWFHEEVAIELGSEMLRVRRSSARLSEARKFDKSANWVVYLG